MSDPVQYRPDGGSPRAGGIRAGVARARALYDEVAALREREAQIDRRERHLAAVLGTLSDGYGLSRDGELVEVNESLCALTGFSRAELIGSRTPRPYWPPESVAEAARVRHELLAAGGGTRDVELVRKDGRRFTAELTVRASRRPDGSPLGDIELIRDVSERVDHQAELERLATLDPSTGLLNDRLFKEILQTECARAVRHRRPLSLVLLDIDGMRAVNERHGHEAGDELIREASARLALLVRDGEHLARTGGAELAWILPDAAAAGAYAAAERARHAVGATPFPGIGVITVSAGVCDLAECGEQPEQLLEGAARALRAAKLRGRNQTVLHAQLGAAVAAGR